MKHAFILVLLLCVGLAGCDVQIGEDPICPGPDCPVDQGDCPVPLLLPVDLPEALRCQNYAGGSCMHASLISVFRWQGLHEMADWWRANYSGPESVLGLAQKAKRFPWLKYAYTSSGDADFLEWCSRTRRGAAIHYYPNHAVTFCGYEGSDAILLDNNRTGRLIRIDKSQFLREWRGYGGYALTVVYSPTPPRPWVPQH